MGALMIVELKDFGKCFAAFFRTAGPFFFLSLLPTILGGFSPDFIKKEITLALNEHLAPHSIILLGCLEPFIVGFIMLPFGSLKAEHRLLVWVHERLIAGLTRCNSSLLGVVFGHLWGLVMSALVGGDYDLAWRLAFVSIFLPGGVSLMWVLTRFPLYEKFPFAKSNHARVFGIAACLGTLLVAYSTYGSLPY
jgi:hypothetical protein